MGRGGAGVVPTHKNPGSERGSARAKAEDGCLDRPPRGLLVSGRRRRPVVRILLVRTLFFAGLGKGLGSGGGLAVQIRGFPFVNGSRGSLG